MEQDELLAKAVASVRVKEHKILDEFVKAFLAHQSLQGLTIEDVFQNYRLCIQHVWNSPCIETKYHLEKIEKEED